MTHFGVAEGDLCLKFNYKSLKSFHLFIYLKIGNFLVRKRKGGRKWPCASVGVTSTNIAYILDGKFD